MEVNVVGVGVTGFATAEVLKRLGHQVRVYDANPDRQLELVKLGYPSLQPDQGDVTFFCVPEWNVDEALAAAPRSGLWVVRSSTRPGDIKAFQEAYSQHIVHLPEFLREATSLSDALSPDRIVVGECCREHGSLVVELFAPLMAPIVRVDPTTSEMIKLVSNAHLSTLISFWNEVHQICQKARVNSTIVGKIVSSDPRISTYGAVMHGKPFGGFCLPKDLDSLINAARLLSFRPLVLEAVREVNDSLATRVNGHLETNGRVRL